MPRYNMTSMRSNLWVLAFIAVVACREKVAPPAAAPPAPTLSLQTSPLRTDAACAAPFDAPGAREKLRAATGQLRIGVLAGLKDADEDNVAWIRKLVAELKGRGADVLIAAGDLGDNPDEQETLLGAVAESGLPVIAVAGNREVRSDLDAAGDRRGRGRPRPAPPADAVGRRRASPGAGREGAGRQRGAERGRSPAHAAAAESPVRDLWTGLGIGRARHRRPWSAGAAQDRLAAALSEPRRR